MRVLIVDDSSVMRKIVTRGLRQAGFAIDEILEAGDGQKGLEVLKANPCDLILSDWNMPNMDGLTFVKEVRKSDQTPIVMVTTEGGEGKVNEAIASGANGHIKKPFTPDTLKETLGQFFK
uniref:Chemotaxis protein cheY, chemotaxis regulator transmitting signal to flagellar motor component. regulator of chemotaxis and motility n=1 Tax=Magnetococcus massalia (strain MO-1) TaxID=451514 RepID=A0A1S7LNW1_MAGMO|nr:Chemotaxis protein cheY, chemotaxis regulator transmitting signal to flagellar motor component. regulator of chemotaxis and motility [Candidatus Magnetococcus massalia]